MAKQLKQPAIGAADLLEYLAQSSDDFAFELRTLRLLRAKGIACEHGGLYEDPVTKKPRQFDIRAVARDGAHCVRLAIECKNVGAHFPLLVSCLPRHPDESFHEIAIVGEIEDGAHAHGMYETRAHVVRLRDEESLYRANAPVGKTLARVGRTGDHGKIQSDDADMFERWAQSLASAHDLVHASYWEGVDNAPSISYVAVIPIVVVPDDRLWMVEFDSNGERKTDPERTTHCSLFVNREYRMAAEGPAFSVSHVELVTLRGLDAYISDCMNDAATMEGIFPRERIETFEEELREGRV